MRRLYRSYPWIRVYGPGNSKIVVGGDCTLGIDETARFVANAALYHSGRACISTSSVIAEKNAYQLAQAVAEIFATVQPKALDAPDALLAAVADSSSAEAVADSIDEARRGEDVVDLNPEHGIVERIGETVYLMPKVMYCPTGDNSIFGREYGFPFLTVTEASAAEIPGLLGNTLGCTLLSQQEELARALLMLPTVEKLHLGCLPPCDIDYGAPHMGFLSEFLYKFKGYRAV